ncbi:MAG TPA: S49 family peptidase [Chlamydiales bacterium]|nr:S49 family peptidase [Chlamydiales bacterium]
MEIERESIFVSALRSFCRMFFGACGFLLAIFIVCFLYSLVSNATTIQEKTTVTYLPDANGVRDGVSLSSPVILQLNIHGIIGEPKMDTSVVQDVLLDSRSGVFKTDRIKGILLHINSPGGTVVDSDNIYRMLMQYKERHKVPIYAYVDGLCASGGMYIACAAEQIYSGPSGIIGSVGVRIGPFFNIYDTMGKVGLQALTITAGLDKDALNPTRPWRAGEEASIKAITDYSYQQFVDLVASSRPRLDKTKLMQEYGAHVFDPVRAQEYGYIDFVNATRDEALLALLKAAQIDTSKTYQVVQLEPKNAWLTALTSECPLFTGKIEHSLDTGGPKIRDRIAYLYQPFEN